MKNPAQEVFSETAVALRRQLSEARAEIERLSGKTQFCERCEEYAREIVSLRRDRARLDWLEANRSEMELSKNRLTLWGRFAEWTVNGFRERKISLREAIDTAMQHSSSTPGAPSVEDDPK